MNLRRCLIATPLVLSALAAPAAAETVTYDVHVSSTLTSKVTGADGAGWDGQFDFSTGIDQVINGLTVADETYPVLKPATVNDFHDTQLTGGVTLQTVDGTLSWTCTNGNEASGPPGNVVMAAAGDDAVQVTVVAARSVEVVRECSGYSNGSVVSKFAGTLEHTFTVPKSALASGAYAKPFAVAVPCGEVTIFQTSCEQNWTGAVTILRRAADAPEPEPQEQDTGDLLFPLGPMVKEIGANIPRSGKSAKVKVNCTRACSGTISATAVAKGKLRPVPVKSQSFDKPAGTHKIEMLFGKTGSRAVRKRGGVIIDVQSTTGQRSSVRVSVGR